MAVLTTQQVVQTGLTPTTAAASGGGDQFTPGDTTWLWVKNGSGSTITVTIDSKVPSNYGVDNDLAVAVAAGAESMIGPLPAQRFAGATGLGDISYSAVTSVTVAARKI